ncbi:MAG: [FeFe] hydrogenase H-cluster radical SAM maturase HydG [Alphaproteobacteria bacterium]|nr:[FeFe] hydrogenase H-cluster radical SAM maturase HydG [Alphaproteobacteria bacterium]
MIPQEKDIKTESAEDVSPVEWLDVKKLRSLVSAHQEEDKIAIEEILRRKEQELSEVEKQPLTVDGGNVKLYTGLELEEMAVLSAIEDKALTERMHKLAKRVKQYIYGNRIVTFAPLYYSNYCKNECDYCAFRVKNLDMPRVMLSQEEIAEQVEILINQGQKRILMVSGEAYKGENGFDYVVQTMKTIYGVKVGNNSIRRVNANLAPLTVEEFVRLREAGVGTYQCFQETYDPIAYKQHHKSGKKADFKWRLEVYDRAVEAKIGDFGLGVLLGLADWKYDILALKSHINHLEDIGAGAHTVSFPRIEPAKGSEVSRDPQYQISDKDFLNVIAIMRLAVPYVGMIMSTRETPEMRKKTLECGISQISAGSRVDIGGYSDNDSKEEDGQFHVEDHRSLDEVVKELLKDGFIPSWCTACEDKGREGGDFIVNWAIPGKIKNMCTPNALITLKEYLCDYASLETKQIGRDVIAKEVGMMQNKLKGTTEKFLKATEEGERGLGV